jgi:ribosome hibernation promoting factor
MNVKIHSIRFDADQKLVEFIETKVEKLNQYFDNIIGVEVFLRLDKSQTAENKLVEIKLEIPGTDIFAKKQAKSFEESTDEALTAIKKQIVRYKEKLRNN